MRVAWSASALRSEPIKPPPLSARAPPSMPALGWALAFAPRRNSSNAHVRRRRSRCCTPRVAGTPRSGRSPGVSTASEALALSRSKHVGGRAMTSLPTARRACGGANPAEPSQVRRRDAERHGFGAAAARRQARISGVAAGGGQRRGSDSPICGRGTRLRGRRGHRRHRRRLENIRRHAERSLACFGASRLGFECARERLDLGGGEAVAVGVEGGLFSRAPKAHER
jgi:hypothetical protein